MNRTIKNGMALTALCLAFTGCITRKTVVYQDAERVKVEFESDAAARLFYETLNQNPSAGRYSESTTTVSIPFLLQNEQQTLAGSNVKFNDAVAVCDSNKDGKVTELEARVFANHR